MSLSLNPLLEDDDDCDDGEDGEEGQDRLVPSVTAGGLVGGEGIMAIFPPVEMILPVEEPFGAGALISAAEVTAKTVLAVPQVNSDIEGLPMKGLFQYMVGQSESVFAVLLKMRRNNN